MLSKNNKSLLNQAILLRSLDNTKDDIDFG
jgi:hypothetical protein